MQAPPRIHVLDVVAVEFFPGSASSGPEPLYQCDADVFFPQEDQ